MPTYDFENTETGEVFNLFDLYPEAKELQTKFTEDEELKSTNKTSAITKLKKLGLTDDEITALIGN